MAFIGVSSGSTKLGAAFTTNQIPSLGRRRVLLYEDSDEPFFREKVSPALLQEQSIQKYHRFNRFFLYLLFFIHEGDQTDFFSIILMSIINISVLSLIYFVVVWLLMPDILYLALAPDFYRISVHNIAVEC